MTCGEMKWIQTLNLKEETDYAVSDSREAQRGTADCQCHRGRGEKRRIHGGKRLYRFVVRGASGGIEVKRDTAAQYKVLRELMHDTRVDSVVCATDAGREGELIFRLVYEMAGCNKPMKRLWISSMEESAIRDGFANLKPGSDYDCLYQSALCRQRADWLVVLNGTRLFTVLYGGKVLKVGRVQTPTLGMLVERETQIMNFRKEQYFMAHILCGGVDAATGRINSRAEAETVAGA